MNETVSAASIACMAVTLVISIGVPVAALIIALKKKMGRFVSAVIGMAVFIIFALILEQLLHLAVMAIFGEGLTGNTLLTALYGGIAAGLFEETGRFLAMKYFMKNDLTKGNAVLYGIGHGAAESILLVGLTYVSNIVISVMIDLGMMEKLLGSLAEDDSMRTQLYDQLSQLWTMPSGQFLLAGAERVLAFALQICLSYMVYRAVKGKKTGWYLLAFAVHFMVDATAVLTGAAASPYVVEAVFCAELIVIVFFTYRAYRAERPENGIPLRA